VKIFDIFLFYNELDLLELRLNTLNDCVDYFVISECNKTFSGKKKPLYYDENKLRFKNFHHKIIHNIVVDNYDNYENIDKSLHSNFTDRNKKYLHKSNGQKLKNLNINFQREVYQRDSIFNALIGLAKPEDLILSSDADEIPNPIEILNLRSNLQEDIIYHFRQNWYMYYMNNNYNKDWFGTRACSFKLLRKISVDLLRYPMEDRSMQNGYIIENGGWHFSFLGGYEKIKSKLDAYNYQGRRTSYFLKLLNLIYPGYLKRRFLQNKDIFLDNRKFTLQKIDINFPKYLFENLDLFKDYIK
jgi:beta-1,4-mannosyl-glycoprotein beta-1,4-N-acetylglucosaminyltransferase